MSFFDNIKDRLRVNRDDEYYDDEYDQYDDYDSVGSPRPRAHADVPTSGLLGNTSRPEVDSVSVYTRNGRRVNQAPEVPMYPPTRPAPQAGRMGYADTAQPGYVPTSYTPAIPQNAPGNTPGDRGLTPVPRISSSHLPPYVLRPASYDDVQMVISRVKTGQPVVLSFKTTNIDIAKRILDFSFGLTCGIDGKVEELDDRVFVVLPANTRLGQNDLVKLAQDGIISK